MSKVLILVFLLLSVSLSAQVKIGNNPGSIDANSLLEMESTNKGFLPPRVSLTSLNSVSPLTGTVPESMLVYNIGNVLTKGYYYWDGTEWKFLSNGNLNTVEKTANATLTKFEHLVLASNDIIITLPSITNVDNGLVITVKNNGTHTDLVTVKGNGSAKIDGADSTNLTKHVAKIMVAHNGNWYLRSAMNTQEEHILEVDNVNSSWATLQEAIEFLNEHMTAPSVIRIGNDVEITETIVINLPYSVTFQGLSYGSTTIGAASGLAGKPMFRCLSESYFKMLTFDATTLTNYGTALGEDAIRFLGSGTYNEVKDCSFDSFYNTLVDSTDAELWVFETDISNSSGSGLLIHSAEDSVIVKVAETDFINCNYGVNLSKGVKATIQLSSGGYYNGVVGDTAIMYDPANFTSFISISMTGNIWNNIGKYIEGFDFSRSDGRDRNATVESNAGMGDRNPNCNVNVLNNTLTTVLTIANTWYKGNWDFAKTTSTTTKWTITNASGGVANVNRMTYQPSNRRNGYVIISGNLSSNLTTATVNIGIVKNGISTVRFGETTFRPTTANVPFQFSTVVYLSDIAPGDYFELWVNSNVANTTLTIQDVLCFVNSQ